MIKTITLLLACASMYAQVPNPTKDTTTISVEYRLKDVYDVTGRKVAVKSYKRMNKTVIDLSGLPSGIYLIRTDKKTFKVVKK